MNGARSLIRTLVAHGVDTCFMNPGTSEMHFVAALDDVPDMRGVLALFEGVATGAADGYARITGRPAATLLHLGPGLGNGLANLHNARRARSPVVNIVGDHAITHRRYDAQLQSDIETVARNVSSFVRDGGVDRGRGRRRRGRRGRRRRPARLGGHPHPPGRCVLVRRWCPGGRPAAVAGDHPPGGPHRPGGARVRGGGPPLRRTAALFIGGRACSGPLLDAVADLAAATGAELLCETFPARLERGAGRPPVERLGYLAEFASPARRLRHLILLDANSPVSFFAYPGKASDLVPDGCTVHRWPGRPTTSSRAVSRWPTCRARRSGAAPRPAAEPPDLPTGPLTAAVVARRSAPCCPTGPSSPTRATPSGLFAPGATAGAPPHDWLCLTGGAIGQGLPVAVGAAVAAPDRRVVALESDGSALYTLQSWWTHGPRGSRRDHRPPQQRLLRRAQHGARPGRGRRPRPTGPRDAGSGPTRPWIRPDGPGLRPPRRPCRQCRVASARSWPGPWPPRGRVWSRRSSHRCSDPGGRRVLGKAVTPADRLPWLRSTGTRPGALPTAPLRAWQLGIGLWGEQLERRRLPSDHRRRPAGIRHRGHDVR